MIIYIDENYPSELVEMLMKLHSLPGADSFEIIYRQNFEEIKSSNPVVFIFDQKRRGLELTTLEYFNEGSKVFAFKLPPNSKHNPFKFCLALLSLYPKFLFYIKKKENPFVCSFTSSGRYRFTRP